MTTGQALDGEFEALAARLGTMDEALRALAFTKNDHERRLLTLETPAPTPAPIPADVTIWKAGSAPIAGVLGRHALPDRITKVTGGYQYEVRPTDGEVSGPGGRRAEEFAYLKWREGDEVSIVLMGLELPLDFDLNSVGGWGIHLQAAEYGSPHWQLKSYRAETQPREPWVELVNEDGDRRFRKLWARPLTKPTDIGLSILWSQDAGSIESSLDGSVLQFYSGPTLSDTSEAYLKWGSYCGGGAARNVIIQDVRWAPGLGRIQELRAL
jgi:hypothetical protein